MKKKGGFSWKRVLGITKAKRNFSRETGIPRIKSGRQQNPGRIMSKGYLGNFMLLFLLLFAGFGGVFIFL